MKVNRKKLIVPVAICMLLIVAGCFLWLHFNETDIVEEQEAAAEKSFQDIFFELPEVEMPFLTDYVDYDYLIYREITSDFQFLPDTLINETGIRVCRLPKIGSFFPLLYCKIAYSEDFEILSKNILLAVYNDAGNLLSLKQLALYGDNSQTLLTGFIPQNGVIEVKTGTNKKGIISYQKKETFTLDSTGSTILLPKDTATYKEYLTNLPVVQLPFSIDTLIINNLSQIPKNSAYYYTQLKTVDWSEDAYYMGRIPMTGGYTMALVVCMPNNFTRLTERYDSPYLQGVIYSPSGRLVDTRKLCAYAHLPGIFEEFSAIKVGTDRKITLTGGYTRFAENVSFGQDIYLNYIKNYRLTDNGRFELDEVRELSVQSDFFNPKVIHEFFSLVDSINTQEFLSYICTDNFDSNLFLSVYKHGHDSFVEFVTSYSHLADSANNRYKDTIVDRLLFYDDLKVSFLNEVTADTLARKTSQWFFPEASVQPCELVLITAKGKYLIDHDGYILDMY